MTFKSHLLFKLMFLFLLFSHNVYSSNLKIDGLSKLNFDDLQALTDINLNKDLFTENDINEIIIDLYNSDLIYNVNSSQDENIFFLYIEENKLIENIYINGNIRIKDELILQNLISKKNLFINKSDISKDINLIRNIYLSKGFNNVSINVSTELFSDDRINIIYSINEGKQFKINRIKFIGNNTYSDKYLSSLISSKSLSFYNLFSSGSNMNIDNFIFDINKLNSFYKSKGFFNVKINFDISDNFLDSYILSFYIEEGDRAKIENIIFDDKNIKFEKFINEFESKFSKKLNKNKNYYDQKLIDNFLSNLNNSLISNNIYNVSFQSNIEINDNLYYLKVFEKKVKPEVINSISIYGNNITKDKTIRSKLNFQPGDYFNQNFFEITKKNLLQYKYINNLDISKSNNEGKTDIILKVDENTQTGQIIAAGTFSGDVGAGLSLGIKDNNVLGTGNNLDTNFLINDENSRFNIALTHYPISTSKLSNKYSIFNTERDLTNSFGFKSEEMGASYSLNFEYNEEIDISSGFSYKRSNRNSPLKSTLSINDNIGNFDVYTFDLSITYDTRNDFLYPTNGALNSVYFEYSPEDISDDSYYKLLARSDLYLKSKNSNRFIFLSNDIGVADASANKLKTTYAFSLGGLNFKGFDYRGIGPKVDNIYLGGNKFFTSTIGIGGSFLFDDKDNISTKLFYSLGSIWDSDYTSQNNLDIRSSVGISFDILTVIGPISFSYAIPIDKNTDDRTREFNFSIGTSFWLSMLKFSRSNFFTIKNTITSNDIEKIIKNNIIDQRNNKNFQIFEISSLKNFRKNSILFLDKKLKLDKINHENISLVTNNKIIFDNKNFKNITLVKNLNDAFIDIVNFIFIHDDSLDYFDDFNLINNSYISKKAIIHKTSKIFNNCVIGKGVEIGKNCIIKNNVVIKSTIIKDNVIICDNSSIGTTGFGFDFKKRGSLNLNPQIGIVIIDDNVHIGSSCTIDRGKIESTYIGKNSMIDNMVHIAHNVQIGQDACIAAQTGISGSVNIDNNVTIGGQAGLAGHISIGKNVIIAAKSGVTKNIKDNSVVAGFPAVDIKEWKRNIIKERKNGH